MGHSTVTPPGPTVVLRVDVGIEDVKADVEVCDAEVWKELAETVGVPIDEEV